MKIARASSVPGSVSMITLVAAILNNRRHTLSLLLLNGEGKIQSTDHEQKQELDSKSSTVKYCTVTMSQGDILYNHTPLQCDVMA
ncbi:hypothetical protein E2C01_068197 [Portunus trituberculatus]|uniref:Uncharacterized protein n=1 Tax=Portunus trituberculatus TaxID=210409 RepID=A0A5B7HYS9_PORTR|nr:hypothetical protein [Portunus trituberculatus]